MEWLMEWALFFLKANLVMSLALAAWLYYVGVDDIDEFEHECRDEEFDRALKGLERMQ